ncbi:MAG: hypothetical protein V4469_00020 [Patescibacteria group bacterium]
MNLFNSIDFFDSWFPNQFLKSYFSKKLFQFKGTERVNEKGEKERLIEEVDSQKQYWITSLHCNAKAIML